ncbi:hemicentin-2-like isoform X2 [Haliotis rubra]|uniref:hemicentin-2-like isoform X2 n=1 Tax=Haliotis rubra TaxID=36100 RepID=UPI001EE5B96B|nr:hemicentin-2-like isoform X2 [Haliotis rubra]
MRLYCTAFLFLALTQLNGVVAQETTPDITEPTVRQTLYIKDNKVLLACEAKGDPVPTYKWYKDGTIIVSDSITQVDSVTGNLTIPSFTNREEGKYQCGAQNTVNTQINPVAVSPVILVREVSLGANWPVVPTESIQKNEGAYAKLLCTDVPESVPKAKFSWFLEETAGAKKQVEEGSRIHIDDQGTLHFIYLEPSDQTNVNLYKCAIYNNILDTIRLGSPKSLAVTPVASKPYIKPKLEYETKPAVFLRSQTAELECVYSGFPLPTVTWQKDGSTISASTKYAFDKDNRKLKILNLVENDEGMYTCIGTNSAGTVQISIFLDVTSGPIWEMALSDQTVPAGRDAVFYCKSRAALGEDLLPQPDWYINGNPIDIQNPPGNGKFQFSDGGKALTVIGLQKPDDIQCFQCNVSNTIGYEFANGCLNIIEPIVISERPPPVQEIAKGDRVNLTVKATTDPGYTLRERWHFKNQTYENNLPPHVIYNTATQEAYIDTSGLTDAEFEGVIGTYYRELYHQYESYTVTIEVKPKGGDGGLAAAAFPWWWIVVVILLLILLIVIFLLCFCCKRKQDEGAYKVYAKEVNAVYLDPDQDLEDHKFHNVARIELEEDDTFTKKKRPASNAAYEVNDDEPDSTDNYRNRRDPSERPLLPQQPAQMD